MVLTSAQLRHDNHSSQVVEGYPILGMAEIACNSWLALVSPASTCGCLFRDLQDTPHEGIDSCIAYMPVEEATCACFSEALEHNGFATLQREEGHLLVLIEQA